MKRKFTTPVLFQHTHRHSLKQLHRCRVASANFRPGTPIQIYGGVTQSIIGSAPRRLHVAAFTAVLVSSPSLLRVEVFFGHALYSQTTTFSFYKLHPLLAKHELHLDISQFRRLCTIRLFDSVQLHLARPASISSNANKTFCILLVSRFPLTISI